jgi:RimJ/RimL family protein N-acetyltransferase
VSPETPTVETARLRLRPWREEDLDPYAEMCADPEVMRYIGSGRPLDREESWRQIAIFIGHWQLRGYGLWAVERREDGAFVGRVGLWQPEGWPGLENGWMLARAHWGHGYATEAGAAAEEFAWTQLAAPELISLIQPANQGSRRVAERLGMEIARRGTLGTNEVLVYRKPRP